MRKGSVLLLLAALGLSGCAVSSTAVPQRVASCGRGVKEVRQVERGSEGQNRSLIVCNGGFVYEVEG